MMLTRLNWNACTLRLAVTRTRLLTVAKNSLVTIGVITPSLTLPPLMLAVAITELLLTTSRTLVTVALITAVVDMLAVPKATRRP